MHMTKRCWGRAVNAFLLLSSLAVAVPAQAISYQVTVDTSPLAGSASQLAFDFIDGDAAANSIILSAFATDGVVGSASSFGVVSGTLPGPVTLSDGDFFNEYLLDITLGASLSFLFEATSNALALDSFLDAFSFFVLDPVTLLPFFPTTDPTGANALFAFNIDGTASGDLRFHDTAFSDISWSVMPAAAVPEPGTLWLLAAGAVAIGLQRRRAVRSRA